MKQIILAFVIWRIFLFAVAAISPLIIPQFGARFPYYEERLISSQLPHFIWSFGNFDGVHYLGIAKNFYADQYTQAFFPLYPLLIKIVSHITFGNLLVAALIISNLATLTGILVFYKLISKTHDKKIAFWSCLFLLAFPTSFYLGAVYTEGFFFLLVISSFYFLEQKKYWQAAALGAFASATRLIGVFLGPFLITRNRKSFITPLITAIGFLSYVIYLKLKFNNPLYFLTAQSIFGQERETNAIVLLPQVLYRYFKILMTTKGLSLTNAIIELSATIFALILLFIAFKKVKKNWVLFSFITVIIPTFTGTLASMPRYILIAFPMYIVLASIQSAGLKIILIAVSVIILVALTTLFTQGYWVA